MSRREKALFMIIHDNAFEIFFPGEQEFNLPQTKAMPLYQNCPSGLNR